MARQENPKTPFAARLIAARKALRFEGREPFAVEIGIPKETLANYERGTRDMPLALIEVYRERFKVDLNWLFTGEGDMFGVDASSLTGPAALLVADFNRLPKDRQEEVLDITSMIAERHGL